MEIKIWNEKVDCCGTCPYYNDKPFSVDCNINKKLSIGYSINIIHKNCPFLVVPTKELIEGLGFRFVKYRKSNKCSIYKKKMNFDFDFEYTLGISDSFMIYIKYKSFYFINNFPTNNFEHLKFILSGFGII